MYCGYDKQKARSNAGFLSILYLSATNIDLRW
ncbi:hypothetical protein SAMN06296416_1101 [Pseudoxanthomonas wuyuanensis]|uniref:Uncharacterized protein n=1 Tax=Pseudoxanthomonas wuyuanensis TaxID=1073196 RepID=A0A286DCW8_9GAMM|nr:hypothetical protein SAMN06296416_1101 [Pseudoxanthomonas wuyuanensis]